MVRVDAIPNPKGSKLEEPQWREVYTKLRVWSLTGLDKVIYLDSDFIVHRPLDDLFALRELSAVPDVAPPAIFNSGIRVARWGLARTRQVSWSSSRQQRDSKSSWCCQRRSQAQMKGINGS